MPVTEKPFITLPDTPGGGKREDSNWQDTQSVPQFSPMEDSVNEMAVLSGYVARQTNPYTGAPLPQPTIGQGSYENPEIPPPPGDVNRGD